ncbi:MAG TPA: DUF535 family protein [Steroidobacteraceae bacterium]|nr:DUF535 family protein [Steroidobacteraceae bacterium]
MSLISDALTAARTAIILTRRAGLATRGLKSLKQRLRWPLLAVLTPRRSLCWFAQCARGELRYAVQVHGYIALKPLRPYVSMRWNREQRMRVIHDTHRLLFGSSRVTREAVLSPAGSTLAHMPSPGEAGLELHLGTDPGMRKEGELLISLRETGNTARLATLALSFEATAAGWRAYIGAIQGRGNALTAHRRVTRRLHGLRPAPLLLFVAQELVRCLGVNDLLAVGPDIHVHRSKHLLHLGRRHAMHFDYERLWREAGGTRAAEGWYRLPVRARRRERTQLPVRKRSQYARRYRLLDELAAQMRRTLESAGRSEVAARGAQAATVTDTRFLPAPLAS